MADGKQRIHLRELTWEEAKARAADNATVLLPAGSIQQHGPHLPVETDSRPVWEVARRAAEKVADQINLLLTPAPEFGYSSHHREFPGTMTLSGTTHNRDR